MVTLEWLHFTVGGQVIGQVAGPAEPCSTQLAHKRSLICVRPMMGRQRGLVCEGFATDNALVLFDASVNLPMLTST